MQFCVHSDKQELIHSLTRSIHDGEPFNSILLQLSKSIADGERNFIYHSYRLPQIENVCSFPAAVKANVSELLLVESDVCTVIIIIVGEWGEFDTVFLCGRHWSQPWMTVTRLTQSQWISALVVRWKDLWLLLNRS